MTQPVEQEGPTTKPGEKGEYPTIELGKPEDYRYIPQREVAEALEAFGYGPSMHRVHALYLNQDGSQAVGVWLASQEEGHFIGNPVLRGVEQAEAIGQTLLLALHFTDKIPQGMSPRLISVDLTYRNAAVPPTLLNVAVLLGTPEKAHELVGFAQVLSGQTVLSEGFIGGVLLPEELGKRLLERTKRHQLNAAPQFPLRG